MIEKVESTLARNGATYEFEQLLQLSSDISKFGLKIIPTSAGNDPACCVISWFQKTQFQAGFGRDLLEIPANKRNKQKTFNESLNLNHPARNTRENSQKLSLRAF